MVCLFFCDNFLLLLSLSVCIAFSTYGKRGITLCPYVDDLRQAGNACDKLRSVFPNSYNIYIFKVRFNRHLLGEHVTHYTFAPGLGTGLFLVPRFSRFPHVGYGTVSPDLNLVYLICFSSFVIMEIVKTPKTYVQ